MSCVRRALYIESMSLNSLRFRKHVPELLTIAALFCSLTLRVLARGVPSLAVPHEGLGYLLLLSADAHGSAVRGYPATPAALDCGGNLHA